MLMKADNYISNGKESDGAVLNTVNTEGLVFNDCWNQIGIKGDYTCSELKTVIHCYECPVYATVGDSLLEREAPVGYLENWIKILEETSVIVDSTDSNEAIVRWSEAVSIIIFRLGNEKLGLPVRILQEVTHPCTIQPLPHRSNELFLGLVNIRGEILLCASLHSLLHIQPTQENINKKLNQETNSTVNPINLQRMIVAGKGEDKWVFPVDELHGIFRFHPKELEDPPVVITQSKAGYTKGIVYWENKKVNYLDPDLLFYNLNHKIL
jgi:chemotaxis-related protein WspD